MRKLILLAGILIFSLQACYYDSEEELYPQLQGGGCDTTNTKYTEVVSKIINTNCAISGCHNPQGIGQNYGNFDTHAGLKSFLDNKKQRFIDAINHNAGAPAMPQGRPKLRQCDIDKIEVWIAKGYQNN